MTSMLDIRIRPQTVLIWLIVGTCLPELVLTAADYGLIGTTRWRSIAYQNGGFWAGLLYNWRPNYAAQPWTMFFSYFFLHGGPVHLAGNMLVLWGLGQILIKRMGPKRFLFLYTMSAIGGAFCFGLLSASPQPMVGASGALFGMLGAWQYWCWSALRRAGRSLWPVWKVLIGLVALNIVMWVVLQGLLAWQTHLGGFLAGWVCAATLPRIRRRSV